MHPFFWLALRWPAAASAVLAQTPKHPPARSRSWEIPDHAWRRIPAPLRADAAGLRSFGHRLDGTSVAPTAATRSARRRGPEPRADQSGAGRVAFPFAV